MSKYFQLVVVAVILALVALFAISLQLSASGQVQSGAAPDVTFTQFDGKQYRMSDLRGRVVVLNIWASWCDPCKAEAALLESTWQGYKDRGVTFLGADYVDTDVPALAFIKQYGITYPNGPDIGSNIYRQFRARGVPETYFIDQTGTVRHLTIGPLSELELRTNVDGLLSAAAQ
jgi:cytochrome c biogenesis protein CcmG/thiol:disulfide interchange protein DsbE